MWCGGRRGLPVQLCASSPPYPQPGGLQLLYLASAFPSLRWKHPWASLLSTTPPPGPQSRWSGGQKFGELPGPIISPLPPALGVSHSLRPEEGTECPGSHRHLCHGRLEPGRSIPLALGLSVPMCPWAEGQGLHTTPVESCVSDSPGV